MLCRCLLAGALFFLHASVQQQKNLNASSCVICATHHKVRTVQVVCAGVRFPGLIHPGLIGTAPSQELLDIWNEREGKLVEDGDKAITLGGVLHTRPLGMLPPRVPTDELVGRDCNLTAITLHVVVSRVLALPSGVACPSILSLCTFYGTLLCVLYMPMLGEVPCSVMVNNKRPMDALLGLQHSSSDCIISMFNRKARNPGTPYRSSSRTKL